MNIQPYQHEHLGGGKSFWVKALIVVSLCAVCTARVAQGQGMQPIVAIHDSELTRALESVSASGLTPQGSGTTSNQWWITQWHYFVMPDSVKETLRSDGTAFTVIGDSNIVAGVLTNTDGSPKYPIVISLASEAVSDSEIAELTNYVAAGGFLLVGSSSFTRNTDGTTRGDFAIANAMGIHMLNPALTNWYLDSTFSKVSNHPLISSIPVGSLVWQMPSSSEEVSWPTADHLAGESPNALPPGLPHLIWQVQASGASVIAQGDGNLPYLLVRQFGKGYFIYDAAMQPLIGHGPYAPGMYAYGIFRNAIQWAFASAGRPIPKVSPWPYAYDAAVVFRHDGEAIPAMISNFGASAQFEHANGASGDYYFCTGALREDMASISNAVLTSLQQAMTNGATICSHNGGLTNIYPYVPPLALLESVLTNESFDLTTWLTAQEPYWQLPPLLDNDDYDYWHWGPDDISDVTNIPSGYASAQAYAFASISNSFSDLEGWGLTNGGPRMWVSPYFNATREAAFQLEEQLGIKITGETKLGPFPHWTLSTQTPDKHYSSLQLPVSDWFIGTQIGQAMENHNAASVQAMIDFYYNMGALINLYMHSSSAGGGVAGNLPAEYVTYSLNTNLHPRIWSANATGVYGWWLQRSNVQITASFATNGIQSVTTISISGASNTNTAVEIDAPSASFTALQVSTNGVLAGTNQYRVNGPVIKLLAGSSVTNAVISYALTPTAQNDFFTTQQGALLSVPAPGVLTNDTSGSGGGLTASLVNGTVGGTLNLNSDGSFTYTPTNNFAGMDDFIYQASDTQTNSNPAMALIMVTPPGDLFYDNFARSAANLDPLLPWVVADGTWAVTNGNLVGQSPPGNYGHAYIDNTNWTDYSVSAQIQFSSTSAWGAGIGGRLNAATGAHYAAWLYPEGSGGGSAVMKLIKYEGWTEWDNLPNPIALVSLPGVGTNLHTVTMSFQSNNITVYFDGLQEANVTDNGTIDGQGPYLSGGIAAGMWTDSSNPYTIAFYNVTVSISPAIAVNDSYAMAAGTVLSVPAPGVLGNDVGGGGSLTAVLESHTANGTLTFNSDGSFVYTPTNNFIGTDSFTYYDSAGGTNSNTATVTIVVAIPSVTAANDNYSVVAGTTLTVPAPGVLTNDTGNGSALTALLVDGTVGGTLNLNSDGSFAYTPTNNFAGMDDFIYQASDTQTNSNPAMALIMVTPPGDLFYDNFARSVSNLDPLLPWVVADGSWAVTNGNLVGQSSPGNYGHAYINNTNWTDYLVSAQVQFSSTSAWGAGIGGRLNAATGAHYAAWVYPEGSGGGSAVMKLIKYEGWTVWNNNPNPMALVSLSGVGTNWHTVGLAVQGSNIFAYFDGQQVTNVTDSGTVDGQGPYLSGGIVAGMWTDSSNPYTFSLSNVVVSPLVANDSYSISENETLNVSAPGVLGNDTDVYGSGLTAALVSGPANGILSLASNGGFSYTPTNNFTGTDSFVYSAYSGATNLGTGTVTIAVHPVLTVTVSNQSRAYGVTNPVFTVGYSGFVNGDGPGVLTGAPAISTTAATNSPVGDYTITVSQGTLSAPNYNFTFVNGTLTVTQAVLTITSGITANSKVYDGTPVATISSNNVILNGVVSGDTANVRVSTNGYSASYISPNVGTGIVVTVSGLTLTGSSATNYTLAQPAGLSANITAAGVTITSGITANSKVYDGTTAATISSNNVILNGVVGVDAANVRVSTNGYSASYISPNVGTGIVVTVSGLTLTGSSATNYTLAQPVGLSADITAAGVAITSGITANSKVYDGTTAATISSNNVILNGVVSGDTANVRVSTNGYSASYISPNVGTGIVVTVSGLTLTGSSATNYTLAQPVGLSADITAAGVTITSGITANSKVYDGTPVATISSNNVILNGVVSGDAGNVRLSTNGYSASYISPNVGTGIVVTVSGLTLTGSSATNYTLAQPAGLSANITAAGVAITSGITANSKVYDGTPVATISSNNVILNGVVSGDAGNVRLSTNGYSASYISPNVGTGIVVTVSGLTLTGSSATNYTLAQPVGLSADITAAGVAITSGITANSKVYDGTTAATISSNNVILNGVVSGDTANVRVSTNGYSASYISPNVGTGIVVTVSGLTLTGSSATNYTLAQPVGLSADITAAGVAIMSGITANSKVYDGTPVATISSNNVILNGVVSGDAGNVRLSTNGYSASYISPNVGTGIVVTVSGLTLTGSSATNYTLAQPAGLSANITAAGVAITSGITANSKVYDGTPVATISSNNVILNGVVSGDAGNVRLSTNGYSASYISPNVGTGIVVTVSGLTLTGSSATNYTLAQPVGLSADITAAGVAITSGITANSKVYDGTTAATISSNNVILNGVVGVDAANVRVSTNGYSASYISPNVGTGIVVTVSGLTLTGSSATNYTLAQPVGLSADITAAGVAITSGITANSKVYDGTTAATISSNNVILNGVVSGDTANVRVSTNGYSASYISPNVGTGIVVTVSGLTLTGSSATNYTLAQPVGLSADITAAGVTITSGITANSKIYDGTPAATISSNNVILNGVVVGDAANVKLSTNGYSASFSSPNVGTGIVVTVSGLTLTGSSATNYTLAQPVGLSADITAAGVAITSGITANSKVYDGTPVATISSNNVILNGVVSGDAGNVRLSTNGYSASYISPNVGTDIVVTVSGLTLTGSSATNYTLTAPVVLTANIIAKALTTTSVPSPAITSLHLTNGVVTIAWNSVTGGIYRVQSIDNLNGTSWTDLLPDVTASGLTATQTNIVTGMPQRFYRIRVLNSGITANNKVYDGTTVATISSNNVILNGVVNGDVVSLSTNGYSASFSSPNVGTGIVVTVSGLTLTGASATNYTFSPLAGLSADITAAGVTITSGISANSKTYDGTLATTISSNNVVLNGVVNGDVVSLTTNGYSASFSSPNVGTGIVVTVSGLTLTGSSATNYTLAQPAGLSADITVVGVTITSGISANNKTYDGTPAATISSNNVVLNGVVNGDAANVQLSTNGYTASFASADVGTGIGMTVSGLTLTGAGATNYTLAQLAGLSANITAAGVAITSGISANNKTYDGTPAVAISSNNVVLNGVVNGDTVSLSTNGYSASFISPNVGTNIVVTVSGLTLTGASAINYTLTPLAGVTANISPATLTVSAVSKSRTYGLTNSLTAGYSGFVHSEGTNVLNGAPSLSTSATISSSPGSYTIIVGLGTLSAANYTFVFNSGTLTVVALPPLNGIPLNGNQFVFTWPTIAGQTYQLQYKDDLTAVTWILLDGLYVGTGSPIMITNDLGASPQRFFRLLISP